MKITHPLLLTFPLLLSTWTFLVNGQAENDNPKGKVLYVNSPSCDHYRCQVKWIPGQSYFVNWVNPPKGKPSNVKIQLIPQEGTQGLPTYTLTSKVSSTKNAKVCDNMGLEGEKCGRFYWKVPEDAVKGRYEIVVTSIEHPDKVGYTDTVVIPSKKSSSSASSKRSSMIRRLDQESTREQDQDRLGILPL